LIVLFYGDILWQILLMPFSFYAEMSFTEMCRCKYFGVHVHRNTVRIRSGLALAMINLHTKFEAFVSPTTKKWKGPNCGKWGGL